MKRNLCRIAAVAVIATAAYAAWLIWWPLLRLPVINGAADG